MEAQEQDLVCGWWGFTIAAALDGDEDSQQHLAEATADQEAWTKLANLVDDESDPPLTEEDWTEIVSKFVSELDVIDTRRPLPGDPNHDRQLGQLTELLSRLARGIRAERPKALPR